MKKGVVGSTGNIIPIVPRTRLIKPIPRRKILKSLFIKIPPVYVLYYILLVFYVGLYKSVIKVKLVLLCNIFVITLKYN